MSDSQDIPAIANALEKALRNGKPIGPAISPFVIKDNFPSRLRPAEKFLMALDITIHIPLEGQECCYRRPPLDQVVMCDPGLLPLNNWLSILMHEMGHAGFSRVGRLRTPKSEELSAEIVQAVLEKLVGLPFCDDLRNYHKWIDDWLRQMDQDSHFVLDAVENAVDVVEFLIDRALNSHPWSPRRKYINECLGRLLDYVRKEQTAIAG